MSSRSRCELGAHESSASQMAGSLTPSSGARSLACTSQLETDPDLLLPKARGALDKYGHQLVIGNDLHRRKYEVVFVEPTGGSSSEGEPSSASDRYKEAWVRLPEGAVERGVEIEETIVRELVGRHGRWISDKDKR